MKIMIDIPDSEVPTSNELFLVSLQFIDGHVCECTYPFEELKAETCTVTEFAEWVATEIFDENWEYNKDAFAELACRKLAKLGIVRAKGNEWELVKPHESEKK